MAVFGIINICELDWTWSAAIIGAGVRDAVVLFNGGILAAAAAIDRR